MSLEALKNSTQEEMEHSIGHHELPDLPYAMDALEPAISKETLEYHYGKHHASYVSKLNAALEGSEFAERSIEEMIKEAPEGGVFNNAAQVWNHTFYWNCMSPDGGGEPRGELAAMIDKAFGSFDEFQRQFADQGKAHFGSGWVWLIQTNDGSLDVVTTQNAGNPLRAGDVPLLTCDVWEHAFYIDYRNDKGSYLDAFWGLVDWEFVSGNLNQ